MTFGEKLLRLRKREGMSQEELAGRLNVSRQAISRWENDGIYPDAGNLLLLGQLFGVSTDYLLQDAFASEEDLPPAQRTRDEGNRYDNQQLGFIFSVGILGMALLLQLTSWFVLQSTLFAAMGCALQIVAVVIFEVVWRREQGRGAVLPAAYGLRRNYGIIAIWLIAYTPVRILGTMAWGFWPRPYASLLKEASIVVGYVICCAIATGIVSQWRKSRMP